MHYDELIKKIFIMCCSQFTDLKNYLAKSKGQGLSTCPWIIAW